MKSFSVIALLSSFGSLSLAQESFPGAGFRVQFEFLDLSSSANLSLPFATISGSILEHQSTLATRQEGVWSKPPAQIVVLTPLGNYTSGTTTVANFANFSIPDGATLDLRLGIKGRASVAPNIVFNVSYASPCSAFWTVTGDINTVVYSYEGLVC
ncbi:hypothetical protein B0H16DRAFT_1533030 [Mycena metata]|uniref:Uncharacterized protein n=1 Tax=Mycena metata TaxID=1033252 RepID=A0AAD7NGZ4_9AGAR|nr:hypothetical protein B0H16DRAFT_1533030 [Mycena metata]